MGKTILGSLFKKESTVAYPFAPLPKDPLVRGHVGFEIDTCIFCGICQNKCPTGAITVDKESQRWEIARFQCILCGECVSSCPKDCLQMHPTLTPSSDERTTDVVTLNA